MHAALTHQNLWNKLVVCIVNFKIFRKTIQDSAWNACVCAFSDKNNKKRWKVKDLLPNDENSNSTVSLLTEEELKNASPQWVCINVYNFAELNSLAKAVYYFITFWSKYIFAGLPNCNCSIWTFYPGFDGL